MNKILVKEDIGRIQELMNVPNNFNLISDEPKINIVSEQSIRKIFKKGADTMRDIFDNKSSFFDSRLRKYVIDGVNIGQDVFDDMLAKFNTNGFDNFTDLQRKLVGQLWKKQPGFDESAADDLAQDLMSLPQYAGKTKDEILDDLSVKLFAKTDEGRGNQKLRDVLVDAYTEPGPPPKTNWEYVELMEEYWRKKIDGLPEYKKNPYRKSVDVSAFQTARDYEMNVINWVKTNITSLFKARATIEKECIQLIDEIKRKANANPPLNIGDDLEKLFNKLITLKKSPTEDLTGTLKMYLSENPNLEKLPGFQKWSQDINLDKFIADLSISTSDANAEVFIYRLLSEIESFLPVYFKRLRDPKASVFDISLGGKNWIKRKGWGLLWKDSLSPEEIRYLRARQGWVGWLFDDFVVKGVLGLVVYPWVGNIIIDAVKNEPVMEIKDKLTELYASMCGSSKDTQLSGNTSFCTTLGTEIESLEAQTSYSIGERLKEIVPELMKQFDGWDLVPTDFDDVIASFLGFMSNRAYTTDQNAMMTIVNNWLDEAAMDPNNPTYQRLRDLGIDVNEENYKEQMDKALKRLEEEGKGLVTNEREEELHKQFPKLNRWVVPDNTGIELVGDGTQAFTALSYPDKKPYNARKNEDGQWVWIMENGQEIPIGDGSKPGSSQQQQLQPTNPEIYAGGEESTGILNTGEAQRIDFDLNKVLNYLRYDLDYPETQIYDTNNDNKLIMFLNGGYVYLEKINGDWYYNGDTSKKVYNKTSSGGQDQNQNQNNNSSGTGVETNTGGGSGLDKNSYINRKNLINQVNPKTLKESIRNKVLLKHEDKKLKIKKINENLRKFEEQFYYENYNKFFNKMFKLAESYKKSKLYLTEDDNVVFDEALLKSGLFRGQEDRMKKEFCKYVCTKLKLDGELRDKFEEKIKDYPFENIGQLFTDSEKVADMIYKSFIETLPSHGEEPTNFMTAIKSTIKPYLKTADFERNFKSTLTDLSNPVMDKARKKVDVLVDKIKELLSKEDSKS
jgi:hypothetical protein